MNNREMVMLDGTIISPVYMDSVERQKLRATYAGKREFMWCACRRDIKLYYRVSADNRIYPEHNDYTHMPGCVYGITRKESAFIPDDEGRTMVFLSFKPSDFSVPVNAEDIEDGTPLPERPKKEKEDDATLRLGPFVRQMCIDTFNSRMRDGKSIISREYFPSALFSRLANVSVSGLRKPLKECRLETDGFQFFYTQFYRLNIREGADGRKSCSLVLKGPEGKEYLWFIFEKTLETAMKRFTGRYGLDLNECTDRNDVMIAGFRYLRKKKDGGSEYKVVGRLYAFIVNANGVCVRTLAEQKNLDVITQVVRESRGAYRFFLDDEGSETYGCFIRQGQTDKLWIGNEDISDDKYLNIDITREELTKDKLKEFLNGRLQ